MAKKFDTLEAPHQAFIEAQHMFFVGTAASEGRVNISPKGMDSLRVLDPQRIVWRNMTGSGNETAGHLLQINRITLMWCGFEKRPMILRAYGTARTLHPRDVDFAKLNMLFEDDIGARQIYDVSIEMVQSSCGYAVPFFDYAGERDTLKKWSEDRGAEGVSKYWAEGNRQTIDGLPTGITGSDDDS